MARAHYVGRANKDIYENGKYVKYTSKKGKRAGQVLEKLDRTVPKDKSDKILIKKGEPYYWWQFKNSNPTISKTAPKRSQLTRSGYLSQLYDLQDRLGEIRSDVSTPDNLESIVSDITSELENLKDECQSSLDNMPEGLQENSSSGQLLQERIDALDSAVSELESVDIDYDEPSDDDLRAEAIEDLQLDEESLQDQETEINAAIERIRADKLEEWLDEKCEEISNVSLEG